jgi:1-acyl-sn-glycerol-3-phosphate acyltransferase
VAEPADNVLLAGARRAAALLARWHQAGIDGVERLPRGPALLVGNHGLFGMETPVFFWLLERATGRLPRGLADRLLFGNAVVRPLLERVGGRAGTRENALALLRDGHLVVCYPGGAREVFKGRHQRYELQWQRARGFAEVAIEARVPVVPFAGLGVDDGWLHLGHLGAARRLLGRYGPPLALGLGPLPLPAPFRFVIGRPLDPPSDPARAPQLKAAAERAVRTLLASRGTHALPARPALVVR